MLKIYSLIILFLFLIGCGEGNIFDCTNPTPNVPCQEANPVEQAQKALNDDDPDKAIELLEAHQVDNSEDYSFYPLLASAYAKKAGIDIFNIVNIASPGGGGGNSIFDQMDAFLPDRDSMTAEEYRARVAVLGKAKGTLEAMPEEHRVDTATYHYASSASFQLTLYSSAYSVMYLNQFIVADPDDPSQLDVEALQSMTPEDAAIVIESLIDAAAENGNEALSNSIQSALDSIDGQDGGTDRDKLIAYIEASENG